METHQNQGLTLSQQTNLSNFKNSSSEFAPKTRQELKFNIREYATLLGLSKQKIYRLEREGVLENPKRVPRGAIQYRTYSVNDVTNARKKLALPSLTQKCRPQIFFNLKGGTGKTTLAYNYCAFLAVKGYRTLAVDIDAQGQLTKRLGVEPTSKLYDIGLVLDDDASAAHITIHDVIMPTAFPNLDLIPGNIRISVRDIVLGSHFTSPEQKHRENPFQKFKNIFGQVEDKYDFIVFDAGPNLGFFNTNGLMYAQDLLCPVKTDMMSVEGLMALMEYLAEVEESGGQIPENTVVIANMFNANERECTDSLRDLQSGFSSYLAPTIIRRNTKIAEAAGKGIPIFLYDRRSPGTKDILKCFHDLFGIQPKEEWAWV